MSAAKPMEQNRGDPIMLELKDVSKSYTLGQRLRGQEALRTVDLTIGPGEIIGLFGENGAGKTTLMKCILGFLRYDGEITLDGVPITHSNIERLSFATSEHSFFPNLSASTSEMIILRNNHPIEISWQ